MVSAKNDGTQRMAATSNSSNSNHGNQDSTNSLPKESNHSNVDMDMDGEDPASTKNPASTYISTSTNRLMSGSSASAGVVLDKSQSTHSAILLNKTNGTNEDMPTQLVSRTNSIEISFTPMMPATAPAQTITQGPPAKQLPRKEPTGPSKGSSKHLDPKNVVEQDTGNTTSMHSVDIEAQTATTTTKPTLQEPAPSKGNIMIPIVIVAVLIIGGGIAAGVVLAG